MDFEMNNSDLIAQVEAKTDEISKKYSNIMNGKKRVGHGTTLTYLDDPSGGFEQIQLLEARLSALELHGSDYLSDRDKKNGYDPRSVKRMILCQIKAMYQSRIDLIMEKGIDGLTKFEIDSGLEVAQVKLELLFKLKQTNRRIKIMDAENNPPVDGDQINGKTSGDGDKFKKTLDAILEIRKAKEAIESQLTEIKTQAKSKISALNSAESTLLDSCEGDQLSLFEFDPEVSPEAQEIIDNPSI